MRLIVSLLLLLVPILGVWTFVDAGNHAWWFPQNVTDVGDDIDWLFYFIAWMVAITFVGTEVLLAWFFLKYSRRREDKGVFSHGSHKLELIWTFIPAVLLVIIAFVQMGAWKTIKFRSSFPEGTYSIENPIADVWASQFDWRFQYPGPDGRIGTMDDVENAFEFVVPVDEDIVFNLRSRDVLHSFFVPNFRLKQDAVPGQTIPVWFNARETGTYDLICAELCGWGHYKMAGRVRVVTRTEYDAWLADLEQGWMTNGTEDAQ